MRKRVRGRAGVKSLRETGRGSVELAWCRALEERATRKASFGFVRPEERWKSGTSRRGLSERIA